MVAQRTREQRDNLKRDFAAAGIRKNSRDYHEYERAKLAILAWQCNGSLAVSYEQAVRVAADFVGV